MSNGTDAVIEAVEELANGVGRRIAALEAEFDRFATEANRPGVQGASKPKKPLATYIDVKRGTEVPVLGPQDRFEDLVPKEDDEGSRNGARGADAARDVSLGRVLRGIVLGGHAHDAKQLAQERMALQISDDAAGGYLLDDGRVSGRFIDLVRAKMVLNAAGMQTVPMDGPSLSLVKLTADPAVSWHAENATLPDSEPSFGRVTLSAKTVVCKVLMSLELAQDAANLQQILESSITAAMAHAIDRAGLVGTDQGAAPMHGAGIFSLDSRKTVTAVGAPTNFDFIVDAMGELLDGDMPMDSVGAMIGHPKLWRKLRKLKTGISGDQTPLVMPAEVAALPKLWTTAAPLAGGTTAKAVIADWRDLLFGVRRQITVRVLSTELLAEKLQVAMVAYARCDFAATRAASFCTLEGITV